MKDLLAEAADADELPKRGAVVRAADAAAWLATSGGEDIAVTVRFPQLGG